MSEIAISSSVRSSLLALQLTSEQMSVTQTRLSTGRKVNNAMDNPTSFFVASGLSNRAADLGGLLDQMNNATQVVSAADKGISSISKLAQTAKGLANAARQLSADDTTGRAALAAQYNETLVQITSIAEDASFNGTNIIKGTADDLTVRFSERSTDNSLTITGVDLDATGLALVDAGNDWAANTDVDTDLGLIDAALTKLRSTAATLGSSGAIISARQDFTKQLVDTLKTGADKLVLADMNEEAANMLALQTRQQLANTALSLSNQADQGILRLF